MYNIMRIKNIDEAVIARNKRITASETAEERIGVSLFIPQMNNMQQPNYKQGVQSQTSDRAGDLVSECA